MMRKVIKMQSDQIHSSMQYNHQNLPHLFFLLRKLLHFLLSTFDTWARLQLLSLRAEFELQLNTLTVTEHGTAAAAVEATDSPVLRCRCTSA